MDHAQAVGVSGTLSVRLAALGGAIFFVLFILYARLTSGSASATDSGQEIFTYVSRGHRARARLRLDLVGQHLLWRDPARALP
ncbi:MAG: hypothetical protein ACXV2J_10155 [Actinomycetes bacterium]